MELEKETEKERDRFRETYREGVKERVKERRKKECKGGKSELNLFSFMSKVVETDNTTLPSSLCRPIYFELLKRTCFKSFTIYFLTY